MRKKKIFGQIEQTIKIVRASKVQSVLLAIRINIFLLLVSFFVTVDYIHLEFLMIGLN